MAPQDHQEEAKGFAKLARLLSNKTEGEGFIFPRFSELWARNLLHLQCEVFDIEAKITKFDTELANAKYSLDETGTNNPIKNLIGDWETLVEFKRAYKPSLPQRPEPAGSETVKPNTIQPDIEAQAQAQAQKAAFEHMADITTLRVKLKEYSEALLLFRQLSELKAPGRRVQYLWRQYYEDSRLYGKAKGVTNPDKTDDLVTLSAFDDDLLSRWLRNWWPGEENELTSAGKSVISFKERSVKIAVAVITVMVMAALLIGSIALLYYVKKTGLKLALLAIFTLLFGLCMVTMTKANRTEVVGSTAAYAAVLVVFIGSNVTS